MYPRVGVSAHLFILVLWACLITLFDLCPMSATVSHSQHQGAVGAVGMPLILICTPLYTNNKYLHINTETETNTEDSVASDRCDWKLHE